jgi:hypothetical protein
MQSNAERQREHANRPRQQHPVNDHDHRFRDGAKEIHDLRPHRRREPRRREAEEDREHNQRQDAIFRGSLHGIVRRKPLQPARKRRGLGDDDSLIANAGDERSSGLAVDRPVRKETAGRDHRICRGKKDQHRE